MKEPSQLFFGKYKVEYPLETEKVFAFNITDITTYELYQIIFYKSTGKVYRSDFIDDNVVQLYLFTSDVDASPDEIAEEICLFIAVGKYNKIHINPGL